MEARAEVELKHYEAARALCNEALQLDCTYEDAWILLGEIERLQGNFSEALHNLARPTIDVRKAMLSKICALLGSGEFDSARKETAELAAGPSGGLPYALMLLAYFKKQDGDTETAMALGNASWTIWLARADRSLDPEKDQLCLTAIVEGNLHPLMGRCHIDAF